MNYILVLIKFGKERAMSLIEDAKNKNPDAFEQLIQPQLQRMYAIISSWQHFGNRKSVSQNKMCK